jgi:hypothetical protein
MKIGFISFAIPGHFNPMSALARQLQSRNHDVVMLSLSSGESLARAAGLAFVPFAEKEFPADKSGARRIQKAIVEKNGISVAADLLEQTFGLTKSTETSVQKTAYPENSLPVQSSTSTQTNCSKKCATIIITRARRLSDQSARELRQ